MLETCDGSRGLHVQFQSLRGPVRGLPGIAYWHGDCYWIGNGNVQAGNAEVDATTIQSGHGSGYGTFGNEKLLLRRMGQLIVRVLASVKHGWQEKGR